MAVSSSLKDNQSNLLLDNLTECCIADPWLWRENRTSERIYGNVCEQLFEDGVENDMLFAVMHAVVVILKRPPSCPWRLTDLNTARSVQYVCMCVFWFWRQRLPAVKHRVRGSRCSWRRQAFSRQRDRRGENEWEAIEARPRSRELDCTGWMSLSFLFHHWNSMWDRTEQDPSWFQWCTWVFCVFKWNKGAKIAWGLRKNWIVHST